MCVLVGLGVGKEWLVTDGKFRCYIDFGAASMLGVFEEIRGVEVGWFRLCL